MQVVGLAVVVLLIMIFWHVLLRALAARHHDQAWAQALGTII